MFAARKMQTAAKKGDELLIRSDESSRGAQPCDRRALWSREVIAVEAGSTAGYRSSADADC